MNTPESYYVGALKRALEGDLEGALAFQEKAEESREAFGYSFSESVSDEFPFVEEVVTTLLSSFDFTRCVRPDGSAYGTSGNCRKGTTSSTPRSRSKKSRKQLIEEKISSGTRAERMEKIKRELESLRLEGREEAKKNDGRVSSLNTDLALWLHLELSKLEKSKRPKQSS